MDLPPQPAQEKEKSEDKKIDGEDDFEAVKFTIKRQPTSNFEGDPKRHPKFNQLNKKSNRFDPSNPSRTSNSFHLDQEAVNASTSNILDGVPVLFPYVPYASQLDIMSKIISALNQPKGHLLVESPTGTGKTMMLLCSALAWQYESHRKFAEKWKQMAAMEENGYGEKSFAPVEGLEGVSKIYYASRTHKQLNQAIGELKKCPYRPRMALLGSRSKFCQNKKALKAPDLNQACMDLIKGLSIDPDGKTKKTPAPKGPRASCCAYYNRSHKLISRFQSEMHDMEDLVTESNVLLACPYYASREMASEANLIFTPYNYLIDPFIRDAMGIELSGAIVIVDEAHNIEDSARDAGSITFSLSDIEVIQSELLGLLYNRNTSESYLAYEASGINEGGLKYFSEHSCLIVFVKSISSFMQNMTNYYIVEFEKKSKTFKGQEILVAMTEISITKENLIEYQNALKVLIAANDSSDNSEGSDGFQEGYSRVLSIHACRSLEKIFWILQNILGDNTPHLADYVMVATETIKRATWNHRGKSSHSTNTELVKELSLWLLSPNVIFQELSKHCKSIILTSGSLSPLQSFQSELGTKFLDIVEAPHIIQSGQVWSGVVSQAPNGLPLIGTFKNSEGFAYQDAIGEVLINFLNVIPYGVLCFLPSFSFLDKLIKRWEQTNVYSRVSALKQIFIEPRNTTNATEFDTLLSKYYAHLDNIIEMYNSPSTGAIFFAVYRGKASEGINFTNHYARAVIAIGIPYPNVKDLQIDLKRKYNDYIGQARNLIDGNEWYEIQAYRALNQAVGRCIRHADDWGAIILLDSRYNSKKAQSFISKWLRDSIQPEVPFKTLFGSLCKFFSQKVSGISSIYSNAYHSILPCHSVSICCPVCSAVLLQCEGSGISDFNPRVSIYGETIGSKLYYYQILTCQLIPNVDEFFQRILIKEGKMTCFLCIKCKQTNKDIFISPTESSLNLFLIHKHFFAYRIIS